MAMLSGTIHVDKPAGMTSARVVGAVKHMLPRGTKVGHAGTLDRFATGVLVLLVGSATKQCEAVMNKQKQYEATIKLGATTETDDPESPERSVEQIERPPLPEVIELALSKFVGTISQRPPDYSALKVGGKRASDRVRANEIVILKPREVQIYEIELLEYDWPLVRVRVDCGRGTYIRSIARDLGAALGVGGYLKQLRRTRVGEFCIADAVQLSQLSAATVATHVRSL